MKFSVRHRVVVFQFRQKARQHFISVCGGPTVLPVGFFSNSVARVAEKFSCRMVPSYFFAQKRPEACFKNVKYIKQQIFKFNILDNKFVNAKLCFPDINIQYSKSDRHLCSWISKFCKTLLGPGSSVCQWSGYGLQIFQYLSATDITKSQSS